MSKIYNPLDPEQYYFIDQGFVQRVADCGHYLKKCDFLEVLADMEVEEIPLTQAARGILEIINGEQPASAARFFELLQVTGSGVSIKIDGYGKTDLGTLRCTVLAEFQRVTSVLSNQKQHHVGAEANAKVDEIIARQRQFINTTFDKGLMLSFTP